MKRKCYIWNDAIDFGFLDILFEKMLMIRVSDEMNSSVFDPLYKIHVSSKSPTHFWTI